MRNKLNILYLSSPGEDISAEQCSEINKELAVINPQDVPIEQISNVIDYINQQLLFGQVEPLITPNLDRLAKTLRGYN